MDFALRVEVDGDELNCDRADGLLICFPGCLASTLCHLCHDSINGNGRPVRYRPHGRTMVAQLSAFPRNIYQACDPSGGHNGPIITLTMDGQRNNGIAGKD